MKAAAGSDLTVGGADLASQAIAAGLVDEYHLFLVPVLGGKRSLPDDNVRANLELLDERRFRNGTVYLHYRHPGLTCWRREVCADRLTTPRLARRGTRRGAGFPSVGRIRGESRFAPTYDPMRPLLR